MNAMLDTLDSWTVPASLAERLPEHSVRCVACAHRCLVRPGRRGICQVRFNREGVLQVPWGYVAALQADPVEKKPFFHFSPGATALTFGMLGCDYHCSYCQNWLTSQTGRDPDSVVGMSFARQISAEQIIGQATRTGARMVVSSYNEPLITSEWACSIFEQARQAGLHCAYVSNGNATPEALHMLRPFLSAYKIDLKSMQDRAYRRLGGVLQTVLDTIQMVHDLGIWLEIVTLVIPGFNDSTGELRDAAGFLAGISADIPWHVTAFHPDYRMMETPPTMIHSLRKAAEIGREAGLRYVYAGNLPGKVGEWENTHCPQCGSTLVERRGYHILSQRVTPQGSCPDCGALIPGIWG